MERPLSYAVLATDQIQTVITEPSYAAACSKYSAYPRVRLNNFCISDSPIYISAAICVEGATHRSDPQDATGLIPRGLAAIASPCLPAYDMRKRSAKRLLPIARS